MSQGKMMAILKCKNCSHEYEGDVSTLARPTKCTACGTYNDIQQSTHVDKDGWEMP